MIDYGAWAGVLLWGGVVGVDLVTGPQALLSRPLVAGAVTGLLLGEPGLGLQLGVLLELFALDTLAVGAAWYPDLGTATVVAVAAAGRWGGAPARWDSPPPGRWCSDRWADGACSGCGRPTPGAFALSGAGCSGAIPRSWGDCRAWGWRAT